MLVEDVVELKKQANEAFLGIEHKKKWAATPAQRRLVSRLVQAGVPQAEIISLTGTSRSSIDKWVSEFRVKKIPRIDKFKTLRILEPKEKQIQTRPEASLVRVTLKNGVAFNIEHIAMSLEFLEKLNSIGGGV